MRIIGIDPGLSGAVAIINGAQITFYDTPTEQIIKTGGSKKTDYLPTAMADILAPFAAQAGIHAFIEKVSAMPGQGVTSMFGFGKGFGIWLGVLAGLSIPYTLVIPQRWKKELMQGLGDKEAAIGRACSLYPQCSAMLTPRRGEVTKPQSLGRADALLIATYGKRYINGNYK